MNRWLDGSWGGGLSGLLLLTLMLMVGAAGPAMAEGAEPVTVVAYDFEDEQARLAPSETHPEVEAGRFMHPGFFPPPDRYFDGSIGGEPGEAIVDRDTPRYYDFTVEGLDALERLDTLRFTLTTRQSHSAAGHHVSVMSFDAEEAGVELAFDFDMAEKDSDEPEEEAVRSAYIGGAIGTQATVTVDLSGLDRTGARTFRIEMGEPRMKSRTAIDDVRLTGVPASD